MERIFNMHWVCIFWAPSTLVWLFRHCTMVVFLCFTS